MGDSQRSNALEPAAYQEYVALFDALSHPMRIKIMGILAGERQYVSELARMLYISRPLLYMHLKKLEAAGLVTGTIELSESGKAARYFESTRYSVHITPALMQRLGEAVPAVAPEKN